MKIPRDSAVTVVAHSETIGGCFQKKYGNDFIVSPGSIVLGLVGWKLI